MRVWEGIEREGAQTGVKTLFVESARILMLDLHKIRNVAKKRGISRIYIGAGKLDVIQLEETWNEVLIDYDVVIETTPQNLDNIVSIDKFQSVVLRNDISLNDYSNVVPKIDNGKSVTLFYNGIKNTIDTVQDGLYTDTDKIIEI